MPIRVGQKRRRLPKGIGVQPQGEMEYERGPGSKFDMAGRGAKRLPRSARIKARRSPAPKKRD